MKSHTQEHPPFAIEGSSSRESSLLHNGYSKPKEQKGQKKKHNIEPMTEILNTKSVFKKGEEKETLTFPTGSISNLPWNISTSYKIPFNTNLFEST